MAKRGRPRLNRPAIDLGTPEQIRRRAEAVGPQRPGWPPPDTKDGTTALGRLLWRGYLHGDYDQAKKMFDAGEHLGALWMLAYPKSNPIGTLGRFIPSEDNLITDEDRAAAYKELTGLTKYLGKERAVLDAVLNCVVYQRLNPRQLEKLRTGLCRLVEYQKQQRRAA